MCIKFHQVWTLCSVDRTMKMDDSQQNYLLYNFFFFFFFWWNSGIIPPSLRSQWLTVSNTKLPCYPTIYPDHLILFFFFFQCIMFPSWASVNVFTFCNSCVWVPQLSSVWKYGYQNYTATALKGSNMQKMLENQRMCRTWRIVLINSGECKCSGQTRDSWTTITKH